MARAEWRHPVSEWIRLKTFYQRKQQLFFVSNVWTSYFGSRSTLLPHKSFTVQEAAYLQADFISKRVTRCFVMQLGLDYNGLSKTDKHVCCWSNAPCCVLATYGVIVCKPYGTCSAHTYTQLESPHRRGEKLWSNIGLSERSRREPGWETEHSVSMGLLIGTLQDFLRHDFHRPFLTSSWNNLMMDASNLAPSGEWDETVV